MNCLENESTTLQAASMNQLEFETQAHNQIDNCKTEITIKSASVIHPEQQKSSKIKIITLRRQKTCKTEKVGSKKKTCYRLLLQKLRLVRSPLRIKDHLNGIVDVYKESWDGLGNWYGKRDQPRHEHDVWKVRNQTDEVLCVLTNKL
jgi:hypothetical protein